MPESIEILGQKIKAKHPEYADVSDIELGRKIKAKYPGSYDDFTDIQQAPNEGLSGPASIDTKKLVQEVSRNPLEPLIVQQQVNQGKKVPVGSSAEEIGNMVGNALPMAGGALAGIPGAAAGSILKNIGRANKLPGFQGEPSMTDVGVDTLLQGVTGKLAGSVLNRGPKGTLAEGLSKIGTKSPSIANAVNAETNAVESAAVNARNQASQQLYDQTVKKAVSLRGPEDIQLPPAASLLLNPSKMVSGSIGHDLYKSMKGEIPIDKVVNRAFSDVNDLRQLKLITGDVSGIERAGINRAIGRGKIDPDKVLEALSGPDSTIYNEAIRPDVRNNIKNLMGALKEGFKPETYNALPTDASILSLSKGKLLLGAPVAAAAHLLGVPGGALGAASGIVLGEGAINLLMKDPTLAKLTIAAVKTPQSSPMSPIINKAIMAGLRGAMVMVNGENAVIGPKGELQYPRK